MGAIVALWLMAAASTGGAEAAGPRAVVQTAVTRVVTMLSDAEPPPGLRVQGDRGRTELRRVAGALFDFDEMARRTLTRHWAERTKEEQEEFVRLFADLLERAYLPRIEEYAGESILYLAESIDGPYATVRSKVISRRRTETPVDYRLHLREGRWRVYDLLIDHVSFVSTYRSEFARIIQLTSYDALVQTLRARSGGLTRRPPPSAAPRID
ncbi:MAG TPA: ABC transporter substrate-binding protein [Candidatus Limnocylindria bacterium]|nr:ABC transporter substrate-binding protein [Candidatus Limnocylindria bacterium]